MEPDAAERWADEQFLEPDFNLKRNPIWRGMVAGYRAGLAASPSEEALRMLQEAWDILNGASIYLGHRERLSAEISAYLAALLRTTKEEPDGT